MRELTADELKDVEQCGRVAFTFKEVAYHLQLPIPEVREQFMKEKGEIFEHWMRGRLQVELEIRQVVVNGAKNGSTPMIEKLLEFFKRTEREHKELFG